MNIPRLPVARIVSALVLAGVSAFAVAVVRSGGRAHAPPAGRCEVASTRAITSDASDRAVGVLREDSATWVLIAHGRTARLLRVSGAREAPATVMDVPLADPAAVSGPLRTDRGVAFVTGQPGGVRAHWVDGRAGHDADFPRGEVLSARATAVPRVSAAIEDDGTLTALAQWGAAGGTRRVHLRDTHESPGLGPRRRDRFVAPSMALAGAAAVVADVRRMGAFEDDTTTGERLELVVFPAGPFDTARPAMAVLADAPAVGRPSVAALDDRTVAVVWRQGRTVRVARATVGPGHVEAGAAENIGEVDEDSPTAVAPLGPDCALIAWAAGGALVARRHCGGVPGAAQEVRVPVAAAVTRLVAARCGAGALLAAATAAGAVTLWRVDGSTAPPALTASAVPTATWATHGLGALSLAGDASGATLVRAGVPRPDGNTPVQTVAYDALGSAGAAKEFVVPHAIAAATRLDAAVTVVGGPARGTLRLQRLEDQADEGPGEDLLLRGAVGRDTAMAASLDRHRVWAADVNDVSDDPLHARGSVVVHSAIDVLEDGPRTEAVTGVAPEATFGRVFLHRMASASATWTMLGSGANDGTSLRGPWAFRFDAHDRPAGTPSATSPFAGATPLLPPALRTNLDRIGAVAWSAAAFAAIVSGPRAGVRLVVGDATQVRADGALTDEPPTMVRAATVVPAGSGWATLWLDVTTASPVLRVRRFDAAGRPMGAALTLGEFISMDEDALGTALAAAPGRGGALSAVVPTRHGLRIADVVCAE